MRGSGEAVAVARDVASSSPAKPPSAFGMMRYQRVGPDCLPLPNGGGGGSRKPTAAPRSSKDDDTPAVASDSSRMGSCLATSSIEFKPRPRAPQPPPPAAAPAAPSSSAAAAGRSPAPDHGHHHSDFSDQTSPISTGGGAVSGSAGPDATVLLQWGHNKRSRGRRDASASSATAPSPQRRQAVVKIQRRSSAPAEKLMPPPTGTPSSRHGRYAIPHHRSGEERVADGPSASKAERQQRASSDSKAAEAGVAMATAKAEPKYQQSGGGDLHGAGSSSKAPAAVQKHELPRIYTTLSRKEKEEDFLAMKGTKLPQRPKKRPKLVEKAVNYICPGMWLSDVTRSKYVVREKKCTKKVHVNLQPIDFIYIFTLCDLREVGEAKS
ncbi:hypothetical protein ABZP36_031295 [Zizania latifolia]